MLDHGSNTPVRHQFIAVRERALRHSTSSSGSPLSCPLVAGDVDHVATGQGMIAFTDDFAGDEMISGLVLRSPCTSLFPWPRLGEGPQTANRPCVCLLPSKLVARLVQVLAVFVHVNG